MTKEEIDNSLFLCFGLLFIFVSVTLYNIDTVNVNAAGCGGILFLLGVPLTLIGFFLINSIKKAIGIILGFTGFLLIALVIISMFVQNLAGFTGFGKFLVGLLMIGATWFVFSPPDFGVSNFTSGFSRGVKNTGMKNDSSNNYLGLTKIVLNDDTSDSALWDIINSDSHLSELSRADPNLASKIQATLDYYNPNAGVFGSWARRMRGEGRTKMLEVLNKEQQLLIEQASFFEEKVIQGQKSKAEYKMYLAQNAFQLMELRNNATLNQQAYQEGMLPRDLSDINKEKKLSEIRMQEERHRQEMIWEHEREVAERHRQAEEAEHQRKMQLQEQESVRKMQEHKTRIEADLQNKVQEFSEQIQAGVTADYLKDNQQIILIQGLIDKQHKEIAEIQRDNNLDSETKAFMIADRRAIIENFVKQRNETANRLLQKGNW